MCAGGLEFALGSLTDAYAIYVLFGILNEPMPAIDSQNQPPKNANPEPLLERSMHPTRPAYFEFQLAREFSEVPLSSRIFSVRS
jgi:hypothetical protein